jgi:hypothetical protein
VVWVADGWDVSVSAGGFGVEESLKTTAGSNKDLQLRTSGEQ